MINGSANGSQTTLTVTCTPGTAYDVGLDNGTHATGGVRRMVPTIGSASIPCALYSNASRTVAWGNMAGTHTVTGTAGIVAATLNVYGRVPAGFTPVAADACSDAVTVTVTVTFWPDRSRERVGQGDAAPAGGRRAGAEQGCMGGAADGHADDGHDRPRPPQRRGPGRKRERECCRPAVPCL